MHVGSARCNAELQPAEIAQLLESTAQVGNIYFTWIKKTAESAKVSGKYSAYGDGLRWIAAEVALVLGNAVQVGNDRCHDGVQAAETAQLL